MKKKRLDHLLIERELFETRARAQARIMAGDVFVDGQRRDKAGQRFADDVAIEVRGEGIKYASRGGLKLEAALDAFGYDCADQVVIDVGASTGGFTDCVLQRGAARVYAVDVGYGQLAWKLRTDERVVVIERMNIRKMPHDHLPEACDLAVIDCSFISLDKVLAPTRAFLKPEASVVALIKPQFEVGRDRIGKGGVVRDAQVRAEAIEEAVAAAEALGFARVDGIDCPVHGPAGNVEYLVWLRRVPGASGEEE
jgi:23S rRNA (cytidine1920-2'-O)/16S rRNA (cytidine1409-2'-O)-methyltransferase